MQRLVSHLQLMGKNKRKFAKRMDKPHFFATLESSDWAKSMALSHCLWVRSLHCDYGLEMTWRFKKRSKILFYLHSFPYDNTFEFSSPQKETMTIEMASHSGYCLNWLKDRKLPVLRDGQQHLIFLPKPFFFSANFFLLNSYHQHWTASPCVTSTGLSYNNLRAGERGAIKSFSANPH